MAVTTTQTNKPFNPRGNDQSPKGYNRAQLFSGKALDFDGVNDYVSGADNLPTSNYTICSYFKVETFGSSHIVFQWGENTTGKRRAMLIWTGGSGSAMRVVSSTASSNIAGDTELETGRWYFACVSVDDSGNANIYVNGQHDGSGVNTLNSYTAGNYYVGSVLGAGEWMNGQIANTRIFNQVLTAAQVADLYNNPEKVVPTGVADSALKLWLPMQEGAGTTAYDGSGNGNHGTISGATYTHGIGAPVSQTAVIDWNKGVNLLRYSEKDTNLSVAGGSSFNNFTTAPNGLTTAGRFQEDTTSGNHGIHNNTSSLLQSPTKYVFSVFLKKLGRTYVGVQSWYNVSSGAIIYVNLDNGTIEGTYQEGTGFSVTDEAIESHGDGWYRVSGVFTSSATTHYYGIAAMDSLWSSGTSYDNTYSGDATKGFYWWGMQLEQADEVGAYIPNYSGTSLTSPVLLPQGLTSGRDITGVNLFENVRKQGALNLDGNSWAEVHDNASLDFGTGEFTLEAWVKAKYVNDGSSYNAILTLGGNAADNTSLSITSSLEMRFEYAGDSSSVNPSTEGDWVHIVGTYDETNATFYIDGAQADQDARAATNITNALVKRIGRDTTGNRFYTDQISQPRIYNRALTAEEVQRNYNAGKNIYK